MPLPRWLRTMSAKKIPAKIAAVTALVASARQFAADRGDALVLDGDVGSSNSVGRDEGAAAQDDVSHGWSRRDRR